MNAQSPVQGTATGKTLSVADPEYHFSHAPEPRWRLELLLSGGFSAHLRGLKASLQRASGLEPPLGAAAWSTTLEQLVSMLEKKSRLACYLDLRLAEDVGSKKARLLQLRAVQTLNSVDALWDAAIARWQALSAEEAERLLSSPELERWSHWLRLHQEATLDSQEEQEELATRGHRYERELATLSLGKGEQACTLDEVPDVLRYNPDPAARRKTSHGLHQALTEAGERLAAHVDAVMLARVASDRARGASLWTAATAESGFGVVPVEEMLAAVSARRRLAEAWARRRAAALGVDQLDVADLWAPLLESTELVPFDQACRWILDTINSLNPGLTGLVSSVLDGRLDPYPRPGKAQGYFCVPAPCPPGAFVASSFQGRIDDVFVLAHELGHALHYDLLHTCRTPLDQPQRAAAELGACLLETAVIDFVREISEPSLAVTLADRWSMGIFRQAALVRLEEALYELAAQGKRLDVATLNRTWLEAHVWLYGDAVAPDAAMTWTYASPLVYARLYPASYCFAYITSLGLAADRRKSPRLFGERLEAFLSAGAEPLDDLLGLLGARLEHDLWGRGLDEVQRTIEAAEAVVGSSVRHS